MSIRGIDTQIMIARTADVSRENSALQKLPQASQDTMALRGQQESARAQESVQATLESEMQNIRPDAEGGGSGAAGGGGGGSREEEELTEEQERELLVAPADHDQIIDIMI